MIRLALLAVLAVSLFMMSTKVYFYRPLLALQGGRTFVIETASLLAVYALLVVWMTRDHAPLTGDALLLSTSAGVIGGAIQSAHLIQETFVDLGPVWNGITGLGLLFCTFVLWGIAGYRTAQRTGSAWLDLLAGAWCAIVNMSAAVLVGFLMEFYLAVPKPEYVATWGEFKRSGWTDIHAFTIANTLDSARSHLLIGPVLGAIFGGVAGLTVRIRGKQQPDVVGTDA
jgi:hypothetical protein